MSENSTADRHGDEQKCLLTKDETVEILESPSPDRLEMVAGLLEVLERQQLFARMDKSSKRHEAERQHKLKEAAEIAEGNTLDDVERMTLQIIGNLAMNFCLPREQIHDDGGNSFYYLFKTIDSAVRDALPSLDIQALDCIKEAEREKGRKASL